MTLQLAPFQWIPGKAIAFTALALQTALLVNLGAPAAPEHLRLQRTILLPAGASGTACVGLDAAVLAHTASAAHSDLRIYRGYPGSAAQAEVPYVFTESGPEPVEAVQARVEHVVRAGDALRFDLRMPPRAYSELQLKLEAHDFVGTVTVTGEGGPGGAKPLGSFAIFDLRGEGLGRWTSLPMAESTLPLLHFTLALRTPGGQPIHNLPPSLVQGVAVPPSRERQTAYTPVASTQTFHQQGHTTVATLYVPAHVPLEALRITLKGGVHPNFARVVRLSARSPDEPFNDPETLDAGLIENVRLPSGDPRLNPIDVEENRLPATLGATLASRATVEILVENDRQPPLPLASLTLEMRERRLCFQAESGAVYTLRYGDPALSAPLYAHPPQLGGPVTIATLGPEQRNPHWSRRPDTRPFFSRHPEFFWVLVLACAGMMGGTALQFVQSRSGGVRG